MTLVTGTGFFKPTMLDSSVLLVRLYFTSTQNSVDYELMSINQWKKKLPKSRWLINGHFSLKLTLEITQYSMQGCKISKTKERIFTKTL